MSGPGHWSHPVCFESGPVTSQTSREPSMDIVRRCIAEFIGTFALVFVGVGAVSISPDKGGGLLSIALAFGLTVAVMVSATLHISGGQFNPAVSLALLATRKMSLHDALFYILTQLIAAVAAAGVIQLMFGGY